MYRVTLVDPEWTVKTIDADEHSIEPAITAVALHQGPCSEVVRFWKAGALPPQTPPAEKAEGIQKSARRELVAVIPFHLVRLIERPTRVGDGIETHVHVDDSEFARRLAEGGHRIIRR